MTVDEWKDFVFCSLTSLCDEQSFPPAEEAVRLPTISSIGLDGLKSMSLP